MTTLFYKLFRIIPKLRSIYYRNWNKLYFKLIGIKFGKNMRVFDKIYVVGRGSITIGDNFVFLSGDGLNPLARNIQGLMFVPNSNSIIEIGNNVGISCCSIRAGLRITIGNNVNIGADCLIIDTDAHPHDYLKRRSGYVKEVGEEKYLAEIPTAPIVIEDDVWIGARCQILKGVTIGARSIIAAGSIVTKDIPADCVAGGVPARVIKRHKQLTKMDTAPKITVVTVCYNAAAVIEETILSVINQTYSNIEYIIIDGASTDNTVQIVNKYRNRISVVVSEPDKGIYDAMNKGIKLATGDWINFMNVRDKFAEDDVVKKVFEGKEYCENVGFIYGLTMTNRGLMKPNPFFKSTKRFKLIGLCHQSTFVRTALAKRNMFDLTFKITADYKQLKTIYESGHDAVELPLVVSFYDTCGMSSKNERQLVRETARLCSVEDRLPHYWRCARLFLKSIVKSVVPLHVECSQ